MNDDQLIADHRDKIFADMAMNPEEIVKARDFYMPWLKDGLAKGNYKGYAVIQSETDIVVASSAVWFSIGGPLCDLISNDLRRATLTNVFVEPGHRRRGIARAMVKQLINLCKCEQYPVLNLHSSEAGRSLYESLGFEDTHEYRLTLTNKSDELSSIPGNGPIMQEEYYFRPLTVNDDQLIADHRDKIFAEMALNPEEIPKARDFYMPWLKVGLAKGNYKGYAVIHRKTSTVVATSAVWFSIGGPLCNVLSHDLRRATLTNIFVEPGHRRRDIARAMVEQLIEFCKSESYLVLNLHSSDAGRSLYASFGFEDTHEYRLVLTETFCCRQKRV